MVGNCDLGTVWHCFLISSNVNVWILTYPGSILICETEQPAQQHQPIMTTLPSGDDRLPSEIDALTQENNTTDPSPRSLSLADSVVLYQGTGPFACVARAASILDQVLALINETDLDVRLSQLDRLDTALQSFLKGMMQQRQEKQRLFCGAVSMSIR